MKISIILLLLTIVALFEHNSTFHFPNGLIYKGQLFKTEDYPYIMFIRFQNSPTQVSGCTGTLIKKNFVLTAAHCCDKRSANETRVFQGSPLVENPKFHNVVKLYQHKDFNKTKDPHAPRGDLCVLELKKPFPNIKTFSKIGGSPADFSNGKKLSCKMFGFGQTNDSTRNGKAGYMMINDVKYGEKACKLWESEEIKRSWEQYLCLVPNGESTTCVGDSGGPMICNKMQYGVCSFGFPFSGGKGGCGLPDQQEIYSFINYHRKWLDNIIEPKKKKKRSSGNLLKPHNTLHIILSILLYNIILNFI